MKEGCAWVPFISGVSLSMLLSSCGSTSNLPPIPCDLETVIGEIALRQHGEKVATVDAGDVYAYTDEEAEKVAARLAYPIDPTTGEVVTELEDGTLPTFYYSPGPDQSKKELEAEIDIINSKEFDVTLKIEEVHGTVRVANVLDQTQLDTTNYQVLSDCRDIIEAYTR